MDYTSATNKQLSNIISCDFDCPTHLLSGVVNELLERNLFEGLVIKSVIKQFQKVKIAVKVLGLPEEDIFQFCRMKIFESVKKFQPGKSSFLHFALMVVRSELRDLETKVKAEKRKVYENIQSMDKEANEKGATYSEVIPSGVNVEREVIRKIMFEEKLEPLNSADRNILLLYMKGYSTTEIGAMINRPRGFVSRHIISALSTICGKQTTPKELGIINVGVSA